MLAFSAITSHFVWHVWKCLISGSGRGCLDLESWVKFKYIHESHHLLESFNKSHDQVLQWSSQHWYLVVKIVAGLLLARVDTKWPSGGKETKSRLIVKLCFLFDAYKVDWQWILLPQNRSSTIFHSYMVYHKSSIKPPGRLIYFKPIWGRGREGA